MQHLWFNQEDVHEYGAMERDTTPGKAAMRFPATKDPITRKKIVAEIFSLIHVRDRQITGFRFRESLLSDAQISEGGQRLCFRKLCLLVHRRSNSQREPGAASSVAR